MELLFIFFFIFGVFFAIKVNKKRKINNILLKPMKYNLDTRRSPWTRGRGGF
jgi:hypothetical protein